MAATPRTINDTDQDLETILTSFDSNQGALIVAS